MEEGKKQGKQERSGIHLYLKKDDSHHYYGSIANIYQYFKSEQIGIKMRSLHNFVVSPEKPYENAKVIIRKGILLAKPNQKNKAST